VLRLDRDDHLSMAGRAPLIAARIFASLAFLLPLGGFLSPSGRAATMTRPVIVSLTARSLAGTPLPARGARVVLTARVYGATSCTFLAQHSAFSSLYPFKTVRCASGVARVVVTASANSYTASTHLTYQVRATTGSFRTQRSVRVLQAAAPPTPFPPPSPPPPPLPVAPTAQLSITPSFVTSSGGTAVLTFASANATSCALLSTPAIWSGADPVPVECNGTYSVILGTTAVQRQWAFTFVANAPDGVSASAVATLIQAAPTAPAAPPPLATRLSLNWSGYVVPSSSALLTEVGGQWTVPRLNCAATPGGGVSTWAGIGGFTWPTGGSSGVLLQTGVQTDCVNGAQRNTAWWEAYPSNPNHLAQFNSLPVGTGDSIKASVFRGSSGAWETRVDDLTTGLSGVMVTGEGWGVTADGGNGTFVKQGSTVGLSYDGGYTAEWVVEDYTLSGSEVPFANYGSVTFTDLTTSLSPWYLTADEALALSQNGGILSMPTLPTSGGFTVDYTG
jgi:hypothetical protein